MKFNELSNEAKYRALDQAFDVWWDSSAGREFREGELADSMCRFLESTGLGDYSDVVSFEVDPNEMVSKGNVSDPTAMLVWAPGPSFDDEARLVACLKHLTANSVTAPWLSGVRAWADPDDVEEIASCALDAIVKKAAFHCFNWLDLQDTGYAYLKECFEDGTGPLVDCEFDEEGNIGA